MLPDPRGPYAVWCAWLDAFAEGDDTPPDGLPPVDPHALGGRAAGRIAERCAEALNARLRRWHHALQHDLDGANGVESLERALRAARHRATPLRALAGSELLFDELRESLSEGLTNALAEAQRTLEDSVRRDRALGENALRVVRNARIDRPLAAVLDLPAEPTVPSAPAGARSILL
jgi:hypothetical protein